jgi:hypothetical protein
LTSGARNNCCASFLSLHAGTGALNTAAFEAYIYKNPNKKKKIKEVNAYSFTCFILLSHHMEE